ncbi:MAG: hypothetical protein WCE36_25350, partial [Pseudolabrys sp.]
MLAVTKKRISTMCEPNVTSSTAKHVRLRFSQFAIVESEQVSGQEQTRFPCADHSESLSKADIALTHRNVAI